MTATAMMWMALGVLIFLGGIVIIGRALLHDPGAKSRRCHRCWYDLPDPAVLTCPECGRRHKDESQLHRRRRRYGRALCASPFLILGPAIAAWPLLTPSDLLPRTPTRVLIWILPWVEQESPRWERKYQDELWGRELSADDYGLLARRVAEVYRTPSQNRSRLEYMFSQLSSTPSGGRLAAGPMRMTPWLYSETLSDPRRLLDSRSAIKLAESYVEWWRSDPTMQGKFAALHLRGLANANPFVARWTVEQLVQAGDVWPLHSVDPRADGGNVMTALLKEYRGPDAERRSRAAMVLADHFFDVNTHWRNPDLSLVWIKGEYPSCTELVGAAQPAGEELAKRYEADPNGKGVIALRALCSSPLTFDPSIDRLERAGVQLPAGTFRPGGR